MTTHRGALVVCLVLVAGGTRAYAQAAANTQPGRFQVDSGAGVLGGGDLGSADASLRANNPTRGAFRLFATSSELARAPLWYARLSYALTRRLVAEAALTKGWTDIRASVASDAEGAAPITIAETVDQYFIDGSLLVMLDELRIGARLVPFVAAGGGYLRQLHEGSAVVEEGQVYHAGGGLKYWLLTRRTGAVRSAGLRGDARLYVLRGGISFDDRSRSSVAISGGVFVGF